MSSQLSLEETTRLKNAFRHFDTRKLGAIPTRDLGRVLEYLEKRSDAEEIRHLVEKVKPASKFNLDMDEYMAFMKLKVKKDEEETRVASVSKGSAGRKQSSSGSKSSSASGGPRQSSSGKGGAGPRQGSSGSKSSSASGGPRLNPAAFTKKFAQDHGMDEQMVDDIVRKSFNQFDKDGNGIICKRELEEILNVVCEDLGIAADDITDENVEAAMKEMDIDKDGTLRYNDFVHFALGILEESMK